MARKATSTTGSTAKIGFEATLWLAADKLRNTMNVADWGGVIQTASGSLEGERGGVEQYKHVVRGHAHPSFLTRFTSTHTFCNALPRQPERIPDASGGFVIHSPTLQIN